MKNKLIILFLILFLMFGVTGCNFDEGIHVYARSGMMADSTDISVNNEYTFKDFTKTYTEDGCVVTIFYEKLDN